MEISNKEKVLIGIIAVIIILMGIMQFKREGSKMDLVESENEEIEIERIEESDGEEEIESDIMVHISGEIRNPGIIELSRNKNRLVDAIEKLGGLTEDADESQINLALKLNDEDRIHIPKIGESDENQEVFMTRTGETDKIDINHCIKEELMSLPGIGDVTSEKIIDYRTSKKFDKIEDIMKVPGIGEKKYDAIKDSIIVK